MEDPTQMPSNQEPGSNLAYYLWLLPLCVGLALGVGIGAALGRVGAGVGVGLAIGFLCSAILRRRIAK